MATPAVEEYLEAIHAMESEGDSVIGARVAERMGVSAPTMTETLRRLAKQGYVTLGRGKTVHLTPEGRRVAEGLVRKNRLVERWLMDVLGLGWSKVHREACRLEHALSPEVEQRLAEVLGNPTTCPHGNRIPGSSRQDPEPSIPLTELRTGDRATVVRVSETAEADAELLGYLERSGLLPGAEILLAETSAAAGVLAVTRGDGCPVSLGMEAASQVRVRVHSPGPVRGHASFPLLEPAAVDAALQNP